MKPTERSSITDKVAYNYQIFHSYIYNYAEISPIAVPREECTRYPHSLRRLSNCELGDLAITIKNLCSVLDVTAEEMSVET